MVWFQRRSPFLNARAAYSPLMTRSPSPFLIIISFSRKRSSSSPVPFVYHTPVTPSVPVGLSTHLLLSSRCLTSSWPAGRGAAPPQFFLFGFLRLRTPAAAPLSLTPPLRSCMSVTTSPGVPSPLSAVAVPAPCCGCTVLMSLLQLPLSLLPLPLSPFLPPVLVGSLLVSSPGS